MEYREVNIRQFGTTRRAYKYLQPLELRTIHEDIDKSSDVYQRNAWMELKSSIDSLIKEINAANIGKITKKLLYKNIVRGKGLLCTSIMQAQMDSINRTQVYATLVALINAKFPNIGELLSTRCIIQFKNSYLKEQFSCVASVTFIAHLINHGVINEQLALELLKLFIDTSSEDSIELALKLLKICGQTINQVYKIQIDAIFNKVHCAMTNNQPQTKKVQDLMELMLKIHEDGFKSNSSLNKYFELMPDYCPYTHVSTLYSAIDTQDIFDLYEFDPDFEANNEVYKSIRMEILGSESEDDSEPEYENVDFF